MRLVPLEINTQKTRQEGGERVLCCTRLDLRAWAGSKNKGGILSSALCQLQHIL